MSLAAAFLRRSGASSGVTFRHFCSTTSEVNKKIEGDTPRQDHNKPAGDAIPDSAAAGKANHKRNGKQAAAAVHIRHVGDGSMSDAEELKSALEVFAAMEREKTKAGRKRAASKVFKAFGSDLVAVGAPFYAFYTSYMEAVKQVATKIAGCEQHLSFGFDVPEGCDEKSLEISLTPLEVLTISSKKEDKTEILWELELPQQLNYRHAKIFHVCNARLLTVIITNFERKEERVIKKGSL
ncbi:hypothetical protein Tco_0646092 [Tanacetum coccineum]